MVNLNDYKLKEWKEKRAALEQALKEAGNPLGNSINIVRYNKGKDLAIENGKMPVVYRFDTRELYAWSRGARYSGAEMAVTELQQVRVIMQAWHYEHIA